MMIDNATLLDDARLLVARALQLVLQADETLAAAELEQALDTIARLAEQARFSSDPVATRPSALQ